jgi:hypothetical protein
LDTDSVGHGIETVTVAKVGTQATRTNLSADASAGATNIKVRNVNGFSVGDKISIGTPANNQTVTITSIGAASPTGSSIEFTPPLEKAHTNAEGVVATGTGLDLAAALRFDHAANLPFSNRGTGISFQPATKFAHSSNEPVQALGTGITLDRPLAKEHEINAPVRDTAVTTAGYQGTPAPNQWFGGPELTTSAVRFGRFNINFREGAMVLRDSSGLVVDSLNYGGVVDPWAAEGYHGTSGTGQSGCHVPGPGGAGGFGPSASAGATNQSAGRVPDGADTDSNCNDFVMQSAATLSAPSAAGATNIKVASVDGFEVGQRVMIDTGANLENAVIATVGTAGATTLRSATDAGATMIPVADATGFRESQSVTIDRGSNSETAVVTSIRRFGAFPTIIVNAPLSHAHAADAQVSGSGIDLTSGLTRAHASGAQITDNVPTPGAPNQYKRSQ